MKVKVLLNNLKVDITDDFQKAKEYFERHNLPIEWEFEKSNITGYKALKENFGSIGIRTQITGHEDKIALSRDYITIFTFNGNEFPLDSIPTSKVSFFERGVLLTLMTYKEGDVVGETYLTLIHEMMHALNKMLLYKGIVLEDPMDAMFRKGQWLFYYKNNFPDAMDSNFAEAWKILTPHLRLLQDNYFKTQEFVSKSFYKLYGENSKWFIDPRLWKLANFTRKFFEKPVTINNWHSGGTFEQRGFREPESIVGGKLSQHRFGRAIDINVAGMTAKSVYDAILSNQKAFMDAGLTCIEDIADTPTWCHLDIRFTGEEIIKIVKP